MTESPCLHCNARCSHCASGQAVLTNSCFCDELQRAHLETLHSQPLLHSDPLLSSVEISDGWTGDGQLDFLYNGQSNFLYDDDFGQRSPPNNTIGFSNAVGTSCPDGSHKLLGILVASYFDYYLTVTYRRCLTRLTPSRPSFKPMLLEHIYLRIALRSQPSRLH
jgi:hypothetical protein